MNKKFFFLFFFGGGGSMSLRQFILKSPQVIISIVLLCKKLRMESKVCKKFPIGDLQIDILQIFKDDK